jgi:hypothetical protein
MLDELEKQSNKTEKDFDYIRVNEQFKNLQSDIDNGNLSKFFVDNLK